MWSKYNIFLNMRARPTKLVEENLGINFHDLILDSGF
jgi:hypothetical protein